MNEIEKYKAVYQEGSTPKDNPFIQALPKQLTGKELIAYLGQEQILPEQWNELSPTKRMELVEKLHQYKITDDKPVVVHTIEVDMAMGKQPQLIVHDVSRTMTYTWHKGVLAITASLIHYLAGREHTKTGLFLNLDPYSFEDEAELSWAVLERFVKQHGQEVKPVFTSRKLGVKEINRRLNINS